MCGSLRREELNKRLGNPEPMYTRGSTVPMFTETGDPIEGYWNSHARIETLEGLFIQKGWKLGKLDVTHYTEGHKGQRKIYSVPHGQRIKVIYKDVPNRGIIFNIITREARGKELEIHPRFPVCE